MNDTEQQPDEEGEPWFVAVDVCRALEIGNSSQAISRLDADEKMITLISNEGNKRGNPNMTVVNEPGLYMDTFIYIFALRRYKE